jgi:hypothetical protein
MSELPKIVWDDESQVRWDEADTGLQAVKNTLAITAGGATKGARESANPLNLISAAASLAQPALSQSPQHVAAMKALGTSPEGVANWAKRNAPLLDPLKIWQSPTHAPVAKAFKDVTGLGLDTDLASKEAAYKATGAEKTPFREGLADAAEIGAGALPYIATGPVGAGLKMAGLASALGGAGSALGGDTGKGVGVGLSFLAPFLLRGRAPAPKGPTIAAKEGEAKTAYDAAEAAGVVYSKQGVERVATDMRQMLRDEGSIKAIHPKVWGAVEHIAEEAAKGPLRLKDTETLRKVVSNALGSTDKGERRLAYMMRDKLDDFRSAPKEGDVLMGDAVKGAAALKEARAAWAQKSKAEEIERLMTKAEAAAANFSGSGKENAIRREFVKLANNEARMRKFDATERAAIKKIAEGGGWDNFLRFVGRGAPKGAVMQAAHAANILSNPIVGVPMAAIAAGSRKLATSRTERNVRLAEELMLRGQPVPPRLRKSINLGAIPGFGASRVSEQ